MDLTQKHCVPCEGGMPPLPPEGVDQFMKHAPGWSATSDKKKIARSFTFKNFKETMAFVNHVAAIAEEEGHHPDMHVSYSSLTIEFTTHAIGGLSENDFILAAKINKISA